VAEVRIKKVVCFPCSIFLSNVGRKTKIHVTQKDGTRGGNADGDNACRIAGYAVSTALTPFFFCFALFCLGRHQVASALYTTFFSITKARKFPRKH
jgi:hypothetical protein